MIGRLSAAGVVVLEALALEALAGRDGLPIHTLEGFTHGHRSQASARASLSRTLRRLWRQGYVELENNYGRTLTSVHAALDAELARHEADPLAAYEEKRAALAAGAPMFFPFASPAEWLEGHRQQIERLRRPGLRCTFARLTPKGAERLSSHRPRVNRSTEMRSPATLESSSAAAPATLRRSVA
jgi:DNA-binding MarR family transcriptional regulator